MDDQISIPVAELQRLKETLEEIEVNFQKVFYNAVDAVLLIDGDTFIDCNEATVAMLNASNKNEVLSTHPSELSPEFQPDGQPSFEKANEMIGIAFKEGFHRFEWMHTKISGEDFPVEVSLTAIKKQGKTVLHVLWKDLTEQKQAEQDLRAAMEAATRSSQAKSEFLANMSHEIRTPMNAILGYAEILRMDEEDPHLLKCAGQIYSSGQDLLNLIDDILDIARVEANRMVFEYKPTSLKTIAESLENSFIQAATEKGLAIDVEIDPAIPDSLILAEARFKQVLMNLLGNAVKFTKQGSVKVSFECKDTLENGEAIALLVKVSDTGIGIPFDQLDRIFEAFEQVEGQSLDEYGGTGLGLSICRKLLDQMDGSITVQSELGSGSIFSVILNRVELTQPIVCEEAKTDFRDYVFAPAKILIVDDISINRELLYLFLKPSGFECKEAATGKEAVELCKSWSPDLVLMDINMPVMNGLIATEKIRQFSQVPVIAVTASSMKQEQHDILEVCDDFIGKPISRQTLIEKLAEYLKHRKLSV